MFVNFRRSCFRLLHFNPEINCNNGFKIALAARSASRHNYSTVFKEEKIAVDGKTINYIKVGSGDHAVLCLPGALGTIWTDFKPQVVGLNKSHFTVVAWDPPGYGKSRPPARDLSPGFLARDADSAAGLMRALKLKHYSLLGWSDGGITALILAGKYPDRIHKMAVWGANAYVLPEEVEIYKSIRDMSQWSPRMRAPLEEIYGTKYLADLWAAWVDAFVQIHACGGDLCKESLPLICCPSLVLHGAKDPMIAPEHPQYLLDHLRQAKLHTFPDGKHNIHLKYSKEFNKLIQEFLLSK